MTRMSKLTLAAAAAVALSLPSVAAAQGGAFTVDPNLAKRGRTVYMNKGCGGCHAIGKVNAAPDLAGVYERRSPEWLHRWLKSTTEMLQTDSAAMAMLAQYKNIKMPDMKLADADIDALIHYIAQETQKKRGGH